MELKQNGGKRTAITLGEATDPKAWLTAADCILHGNSQEAVCPFCGTKPLQSETACGPDHIGFLLLHCPHCGRSAQFSRVQFPADMQPNIQL